MKIDRAAFFAAVRKDFGKLSSSQVEGFEQILGEWERRGLTDKRHLAYMLATVWHETAMTMQPIVERGSQKYLRSKKYYPWIGRGLVQITWKENYKKFGISKPEDALTWPVALKVMFEGMAKGVFTGKKLSHYFDADTDDPVNARRIINGTDCAALIARHHRKFLAAIREMPEARGIPALALVTEPAAAPSRSGFWSWISNVFVRPA